jgi:hypothetical protein
MRYSRFKRRRTQQRYALIVIVGILVFLSLYILSAGAAGNFISRVISPLFGGVDKEAKDDNNKDSTSSSDTNLTVDEEDEEDLKNKATDQLKIEPFNFYTIQMEAFTSQDNAQVAAKALQSRGGAGYMVEDKYFRVLAMGFILESDAQEVKDQLKDDGVESLIYSISCPGANMEITASPEKIDGIKSAFSLWMDKLQILEDVIVKLDTSSITEEDAYNELKSIKGELDSNLEQLKGYSATQESNYILDGLQGLYQKGIDDLDNILNENISSRVAISSKIKYTYIDMVVQYKKYMDQITRE